MARNIPLWSSMDDRDKEVMRIITGLLIGVIALFTLISNVSYLFTWKADQSLLTNPDGMALSSTVQNWGGKLGWKWSHFLTGKCLGLGSFALIIILFAISIRLVGRKWRWSLVRTVFIALTGAVLASFCLSFVSGLTGSDTAFGGGYGGECGSTVINWAVNLFGTIVTGLLLVVLFALWLYFISPAFTEWITSIGAPREETEDEEDAREQVRLKPVPETVPVHTSYLKTPSVNSETQDGPQETGDGEKVRVEKPHKPSPERPEGEDPSTENFEIITDDSLDAEVKKELPPFDNRTDPELGLKNFKAPTLDMLGDYSSSRYEISTEELTRNKNKISATLANYKIQINHVKAIVGPTVTLYKVYPAPGVKISAIKSLHEDIAMSLHAKGVRVVTLPDSVGIEVANDTASIVPLKQLLNSDEFRNSKAELPVAIGYTITQSVKVFDLADAPHLLVAGATKQGKSVGLNVLIASLLYSKHPSELKFVFIDPKKVEFSLYARLLHHYLAVLPDAVDEQDEMSGAIVKDPKKADAILRSLCIEMDERYDLLEKAYVNKITSYNEKFKARKLLPTEGHKFLPYIVVVVDEFADLTMSAGVGGDDKKIARNINTSIVRLAQKGRAAGIHVVIATQRPSVDVITGLIKTNFPTRIAFKVATRIDSQTILDSPGAEKLIGRGDMLFFTGIDMERVQCAMISNDETSRITDYIGDQDGYRACYNTPYYLPAPDPDQSEEGGSLIDMKNLDERFEEAARMVVTSQRGSTSDLQRRLGMGYAKAGRVMDQLEAAGIVGPQEGSKPRQVLVSDLNELEAVLERYANQ